MKVSIVSSPLGVNYPHHIILEPESYKDGRVLQSLIDRYKILGMGISADTGEPLHVSIGIKPGAGRDAG